MGRPVTWALKPAVRLLRLIPLWLFTSIQWAVLDSN